MKKLLLILTLSLALIFALAACVESGNENESDPASEESSSTEDTSEESSSEEGSSEESSSEESSSNEVPGEENSSNEDKTEGESTSHEGTPLDEDELESVMKEVEDNMADITNLTQTTTTKMSVNATDGSYSSTQTTQNLLEIDGEKIRITIPDEMTMTIVDNVCYVYTDIDESKIKYSVTDDEIDAILEEYANFGSSDSEDDGSFDDMTFTGYLMPDGTVVISFENMSEILLEDIMGDMEELELDVSINEFNVDCIIGADRMLAGLEMLIDVDYYYEGQLIESLEMTYSIAYEYGNASVSLPEDADEYEDYDSYYAPDAEESERLGLPLDGNNYEISYTDEELYEEQFFHLYVYSDYYEGKTFTLRGSVEFVSDEYYGDFYYTDCGFSDSYLAYVLDFEDSVSIPEAGEEVILTATLVNLVDEDGYVYDFCMLVSNVEAVG